MRIVLILLTVLCAQAVAGSAQSQVDPWVDECGTLVHSLDFVLFQPAGSSSRYHLDDYGSYTVGDSVRVTGQLNSVCDLVILWMQASGCIESNTIADWDCGGCCIGTKGNIDGDPDDLQDIGDLTVLIDFLFISHTPLICPEEADFDSDGVVDIGDLTWYIRCMFMLPPGGCEFPPCPVSD
ncbi:MAG TPA: hypothetical protein VMY05_11855 [Acidobacteriota bacterium]|nr:hypothetical protein [Acidobacteriota bacterium]